MPLGLSDASSGGSSGLDLSEFPALANRSRIESLSRVEGVARLESIGGVSAPPSSMVSRPSYGVVSKPAEPPPDFSIHNEDFPALPGSNTFKSGSVSNSFPHQCVFQGSHGSGKTRKVMKLKNFIFQAWKAMKFNCRSWKLMEN